MVGRTQRVVFDGEESEECTVDSGVPQGSVLGPLLFIIFINDIAANIDPATCIHLFADDALLYRRIDTVEDHLKLQADLSSLQTWADQWGMTFNTVQVLLYAHHDQEEEEGYSLDSLQHEWD